MIAFIHDFGLIGSHAYRSIGSWSHCIHCLTCFAWLNDFNSEDVYKARNSEGTCHFVFCVICGWLSLNLESASCLDWLIDWLIDWLTDWYVIAKAVEWTEPGTCVGSFLSTILMMQNGKAWVIYELLQSVWQVILYRYIQVFCQSIQFNICVIDALHMCCIPFECSPCDCLTSSDHQSMFGSSHCPHPERLFGLPGPVFWPWQHAKWSWWPGATLLSMRPLTVNVSIHCCCVL